MEDNLEDVIVNPSDNIAILSVADEHTYILVTTEKSVPISVTGPTGPQGLQGLMGRMGIQGPTGPPGKSYKPLPTLSSFVSDTSPLISSVHFYFPIKNGNREFNLTNSSDPGLIRMPNIFSIICMITGFINIKVKLLGPDNQIMMLIKGSDMLVDRDSGSCINLEWAGPISINDQFMLTGNSNSSVNGYWWITLL